MHRIVKTGYIDMAHRIRGHKGKCQCIHGHTWKIELSVSCADDALDELGMVLDFTVLKEKFFRHVDACFDHTCLFGKEDWRELMNLCEPDPHGGRRPTLLKVGEALGVPERSGVRKPYLGLHGFRSDIANGRLTAETLSKYLYNMALLHLQDDRVKVDYVRVYEQLHPTESYAEYRPGKVNNVSSEQAA